MADLSVKQLLLLCFLVVKASQLHYIAARPVRSWFGNASLDGMITVGADKTRSFNDRVETRRRLDTCSTGNPIDDCWRCDSSWAQNRQSLANCAIGFGKNAIGGRDGAIYVVTDDSDDDAVTPKNGTLRWAVIQDQPLWITFSQDMKITLQQELIMNNYKTIDGRGFNVHITGGAGITIQYISNIIIHGVRLYGLVPTGPAMVRGSSTHYGHRLRSDGSAVSIFGATNIWLDHLYLADCTTNLISAIEASTAITVSNSYFTNHDMVMLFSAHPEDTFDTVMQVTVAYNHFGTGLTQRMPRCRFGYFHVLNNDYTQWGMYAIGGSENPTILSEGNRFTALDDGSAKEVTKRVDDGGSDYGGWQNWNWRSSGDLFLNGAFFTDSGASNIDSSLYAKATSFSAQPSSYVGTITANAGPFQCGPGGYGSCSGSGTNSYGGSGASGGSSGGSQSSDHTTVTSPHLAVLLSLSLGALILCALTEEWTSLIS